MKKCWQKCMASRVVFAPTKQGFYQSIYYAEAQKSAKRLNAILGIEILCNLIPFHLLW